MFTLIQGLNPVIYHRQVRTCKKLVGVGHSIPSTSASSPLPHFSLNLFFFLLLSVPQPLLSFFPFLAGFHHTYKYAHTLSFPCSIPKSLLLHTNILSLILLRSLLYATVTFSSHTVTPSTAGSLKVGEKQGQSVIYAEEVLGESGSGSGGVWRQASR